MQIRHPQCEPGKIAGHRTSNFAAVAPLAYLKLQVVGWGNASSGRLRTRRADGAMGEFLRGCRAQARERRAVRPHAEGAGEALRGPHGRAGGQPGMQQPGVTAGAAFGDDGDSR